MKVRSTLRKMAALPSRRNTLKEQRQALKLSRAKVARILEVDPATVYRQELRNPMSTLWYYALAGIEAEAKDREMKAALKRHSLDAAEHDFLRGATRVESKGARYTAEKMREGDRECVKMKKEPPPVPPSLRPHSELQAQIRKGLPRAAIKAADRVANDNGRRSRRPR
jgi:hypothetical protein